MTANYKFLTRNTGAWVDLSELTAAALDPVQQPGKVKTKADFTPEEIAEMQRKYAFKPSGKKGRGRAYSFVRRTGKGAANNPKGQP